MKILNFIKFGSRIVKRKFYSPKKVVLKNELIATENHIKPILQMAVLRSWMTGSKESANLICDHKFDLLGSGLVSLGKNIDWQTDFASRGKDIKVPWELSRFQFLPTLIKAHETLRQAQGDNSYKYALEARTLIHDWILKNPVGKGVNWQSPMEVSIRACNFALSWYFLQNSKSWMDEKWRETFLTSVVSHGKFIYKNLEYKFPANTNHLLADLTGLLFLGVLFPQFKDARKWKAKAIKSLEEEMQKQVYEDGVDFEASIPYHRLVCEFFGYSTWLCKLNELEHALSPDFWNKLEKMFEFVAHYTKPNGLAPQIGDNDDGRLFIFEDFYSWERRDHKHLFKLAAELFPLNNFFIQDDQISAQTTSKGFNESGIYIMRKDDFYCIVDCGNNGQAGNAGHAHNDTLSFELSAAGEDFIIDPGTYVYTSDPKARNKFRGTQMHNAVMIDNEEMNRFKSYTLFSMHDEATPQVNKWDSNEKFDELDAQHGGYEKLKRPITHRRVFKFNKTALNLEITDYFTGKGDHELEWNFHFAPGVMVRPFDRLTAGGAHHYTVLLEKNGKILTITLPQELTPYAKIHDDEVSPRYGVKEKAKTLTIKRKINIEKSVALTFRID